MKIAPYHLKTSPTWADVREAAGRRTSLDLGRQLRVLQSCIGGHDRPNLQAAMAACRKSRLFSITSLRQQSHAPFTTARPSIPLSSQMISLVSLGGAL